MKTILRKIIVLFFIPSILISIYSLLWAAGIFNPYIEWEVSELNKDEYMAYMIAYPGTLLPSVEDWEFEWWIKSPSTGNQWIKYEGWGPHKEEITYDEMKKYCFQVKVKCIYYSYSGPPYYEWSPTYTIGWDV